MSKLYIRKKQIRILSFILSICTTSYIYFYREIDPKIIHNSLLTNKNTCAPIDVKKIDSILHKENKHLDNKVQNHVRWCKLSYPRTEITISINKGHFNSIEPSIKIKGTSYENHMYKNKVIYIETNYSNKDISDLAYVMGDSDTFITISSTPEISKRQMLEISKYIIDIE